MTAEFTCLVSGTEYVVLAHSVLDDSMVPGKSTVHRVVRRHGLIEPGRRRAKRTPQRTGTR